MTTKRWDIFCKIVDNFGDIGVCWRLAKQLANEHHLNVRLFIDDFAVASKIIPQLASAKSTQCIENIEVLTFEYPNINPAEVVIETFACGLPAAYLQQMVLAKSCWINLDYLSAEAWVNDFHAKPSPHPMLPITRHFFFPGFTQATGGLIREKETTEYIRHARTNPNFPLYKGGGSVDSSKVLKVSLFAYPNAPIDALLTALQLHQQAVHLYVTTSSILPNVAQFFGKATLAENETITRGNLTCEILPFLSQPDYDALLRSCDLNFVRGEDSWIRAIWAAKPFIWQPYIQTENTHLLKLEAFIDLYYKSCEQKVLVWKAHRYWLAEHGFGSACKNYLNALKNIADFTCQKSAELACQTDLASNLVNFCNKIKT